ncbi:YwaF family protein [Eubacterium maltosivorans]|uniref:YwaF family protein n=1 Tax=Eubacterium maltosivorans TaxID=2041044 RepID=UPI001FA96ABD|nr:YwaF family protein [Eubacterium maltosivorans]
MDYFYEHYFAPQNVEPHNRIFSPEHLILSSLLMIFIVVVMVIQTKKHDRGFSQKLIRVLAAVMLALEIFRISWRTYYFGFDLRNIRFDWCNQVCIALPLIVLFKWEKAYPYIDVLAVMGGLMVLIYPLWVFYDYGGIHTMAVQSMVSHGLMVLIALTMPFAADYRPEVRKAWKPIIGLSIIAVIAFIMSHALNENYLLMLGAHGVPVIDQIPYPWYWLLVAPALIGLVTLVTKGLSLLDDRLLRKVQPDAAMLLNMDRGALDENTDRISQQKRNV